MKILLVVHHHLTRSGGAAGATLALADSLRAQGHHVDVVGLELLGSIADGLLAQIRFPSAVAAFIRQHGTDYDVIEASTGDLCRISRRTIQSSTAVFVTRSHGLEPLAVRARRRGAREGELALRWRYFVYHAGWRLGEVRRSLRVSDRVVVLNDEELHYCRAELGFADVRLIRSAPIVGAAFSSEPPPSTTSDAVLVVGGDAWRKGALQHTRVIESALHANPSLLVGWLGRPPQHWWAELDESRRQRITVVGDYDPQQAGQLFSQYGVILALSRFEGFGLTVIEGMSHGLVPIVTHTPGPSSFVTNGHNGFVVSVNADDEVARALASLRDASFRHHVALEAWATSQQFATTRVARELVAQYEHAVAQKRDAL